jgi:uncharacterized protein (DUF1330 family)
MAAYVLAEVEILDREGYAEYAALVPGTLEPFGGRFLVRGGDAQLLEGEWPKLRRVILEFPDAQAARAWWSSPLYEKPKALRQAHSRSRLLLIEGVPPE